MSRTARIAIALLGVAVVVVVPGGLFPFYLPKLAVAAVVVAAAAFVPATGRLPRWVAAAVAVGAVVLVVAALSSPAPLASLLGQAPRYEGLVALPVYAGLLWAGARLFGPSAPPAHLRLLARALAIAQVVVAIVYLAEAFGARPFAGTVDDRTGSLVGTATDAAIVGAACLVFLLSRLLEQRSPLFLGGAVASALTVVLSGSRAGLLAVIVSFVVLAGLLFLRRGERSARLIAAVAAAPVLVTIAVFLVPRSAERFTGANALAVSTVSNRFLLWGESLSLWGSHPLLGVGPSRFVETILAEHDAAWASAVGFQSAVDSPHNIVLQAAASGGLLLLLAGAALVAAWAIGSIRSLRAAVTRDELLVRAGAIAVVVGAGAALLTDFTTSSVLVVVLPLAGAAAAVEPTPARGIAPTRWAWTVVGAALAVVLVPASVAEIPLSRALAAASAGDQPGFRSALSTATVLRPWNADDDSLGAQAAAATADAAADASVRAAFADEAVRLGTEASARLGGSSTARLAAAIGYADSNRDALAVPLLDQLVRDSPANPTLYLRRGVSLATVGRLPDAERDFEKVLALDPGNQLATSDLAIIRGQ